MAPEPAVAPDPPVEQTGATNVNVSVRVDSPGDNGSVTQANGASGTEVGVAADDPQYQPDPPQYQAPIPVTNDSEATPIPESTVPDGSWNWTWNCADAPEIPIDPAVSSQNWTWNWDWDCGDAETISRNREVELGSQYQPSVAQYRPINVNISIRINSPGNDGPVVQTNVAIVVKTPAPVQLVAELPGAAAGMVQNELAIADVSISAPGLTEIPVFAAAEPAERGSELDDCCLLPEPRGTPTAAPETQSVLLPRTTTARQRDITRTAQLRASQAVTVRLAKASAAAARPPRKPVRTARPAPPRVPIDLTREPMLALGGAGLAPLSAADGRFGYIVLVLLAIGFAFAAASRTVATEVRAAAVETGRPPDRPG